MQKPFPGPNLLLPAIRLSDPPSLDSHLAFKRAEATWKKLVSAEHKKWCLCGSYLNHFLPRTEPLKSCTQEETGAEGGEEDGGDLISDADIISEEDFIEGIENKK